jgi:(3S)-malyl-CoA thioesterase
MTLDRNLPPRSLLYVPASNARAIEKARDLNVDMIILDLEDAVKDGMKAEARVAAVEACANGFGKPIAIRINGADTVAHRADIIAVKEARCDAVVIPKVEQADIITRVHEMTHKPVFAMIETPKAVLNLAVIAAAEGLAGLIAGTNDLAHDLGLPDAHNRAGLALSLQSILLSARAHKVMAFDGVFNDLTDAEGLARQCEEGRRFGFDGKTLIHPNQIDVTHAVWSPTAAEIEEALALIEAASGGAQRFRDRMIEDMHVEMAKKLLSRIK